MKADLRNCDPRVLEVPQKRPKVVSRGHKLSRRGHGAGWETRQLPDTLRSFERRFPADVAFETCLSSQHYADGFVYRAYGSVGQPWSICSGPGLLQCSRLLTAVPPVHRHRLLERQVAAQRPVL